MSNEKDLIDSIYNETKENIYLGINVVNIPIVEKYKEELLSLTEYIPNLLRSFLGLDYYKSLKYNKNQEEIMEKMGETRKSTREENVIEFINWIDSHQEFKELLNEEKVKELGDKLETLEEEYKHIKKL